MDHYLDRCVGRCCNRKGRVDVLAVSFMLRLVHRMNARSMQIDDDDDVVVVVVFHICDCSLPVHSILGTAVVKCSSFHANVIKHQDQLHPC